MVAKRTGGSRIGIAIGIAWLGVLGLGAARPAAAAALPTAAVKEELPAAAVTRFAELALACVGREYPNKIAHVMSSDADALPPHTLTPAFLAASTGTPQYTATGCSSVCYVVTPMPRGPRARAALKTSLTPAKLQAEAAYLNGNSRTSFERPYGLAWLLALCTELAEWDTPEARTFLQALRPLQDAAITRLTTWLPKLSRPVRSGEHSQTAFALGLILDWAHAQRPADAALITLLEERARSYYLADVRCPIDYEPSGEDFLSPCLAEADVMRRVLPPAEFTRWLTTFLPTSALDTAALQPQVVTDPTDGKLAHLDGLNLSRAFMLEGIAAAVLPSDPRRAKLRILASTHRTAGLGAVTSEHYEGSHWLGSFATYLVTGRGLR